jgi:hypothetical protein
MVWGAVMVLAGLGGAALYFLTKSPREPDAPRTAGFAPPTAAASATPPAASPTPSAASTAPAPSRPDEPTAAELAVPRAPLSRTDPLPPAVTQWFDEEAQKTRVLVKGIDLEEGVNDSWRMELSWVNSGRERQRPTEIHWNVIHKLPSGRSLTKDDFVDLRFDDVHVDLKAPGPHFSWTAGTETCRFTTTLDDFLSVAGTKKVTIQVAAKEWTLSRDALAILRTFAQVVPPP